MSKSLSQRSSRSANVRRTDASSQPQRAGDAIVANQRNGRTPRQTSRSTTRRSSRRSATTNRVDGNESDSTVYLDADDQDDQRRNRASTSSSSGSYSSSDEWEVERVVGKRFDNHGRAEYQLKWKNWRGEPTWEPAVNCSCPLLVSQFEESWCKPSSQSSKDKENCAVLSPVKTKSTPKRRI